MKVKGGCTAFQAFSAIVGRLVSWLSLRARGKRELSLAWLVSFCIFQSPTFQHWLGVNFVDTEPRRLRLKSQSEACNSQKVHHAICKIQAIKGPSQGVWFSVLILKSAVFMHQNQGTGQTRTRRPLSCVGNGQNCPQSHRKGQSHIPPAPS